MPYAIADLQTLDPGAVTRLKSVGIRTTDKLLECAKDPKGRKLLAASTGFD
jgi:hypothetical protein